MKKSASTPPGRAVLLHASRHGASTLSSLEEAECAVGRANIVPLPGWTCLRREELCLFPRLAVIAIEEGIRTDCATWL